MTNFRLYFASGRLLFARDQLAVRVGVPLLVGPLYAHVHARICPSRHGTGDLDVPPRWTDARGCVAGAVSCEELVRFVVHLSSDQDASFLQI